MQMCFWNHRVLSEGVFAYEYLVHLLAIIPTISRKGCGKLCDLLHVINKPHNLYETEL